MKRILLGISCCLVYYLFVFILHIESNESFEVIKAIPAMVIIRYIVKTLLVYFIFSFVCNKAVVMKRLVGSGIKCNRKRKDLDSEKKQSVKLKGKILWQK